jgi:hypothetical protein
MTVRMKELLNREPFVPFPYRPDERRYPRRRQPLQVAVGESQVNYYYPKSDRWAVLLWTTVWAMIWVPI